MSIQQLRKKLIADIEQANEVELKNILKFHQIAQQQKKDSAAFKTLSLEQKEKISVGLQQLKEGKGILAEKVVSRLNKKYGIA
ncbi:MAG: hypothetical protein MUE72_01590 [Chitinophagaceae bacterium]|nr:hypothetical protein [Chitinophagaceae bacterium]